MRKWIFNGVLVVAGFFWMSCSSNAPLSQGENKNVYTPENLNTALSAVESLVAFIDRPDNAELARHQQQAQSAWSYEGCEAENSMAQAVAKMRDVAVPACMANSLLKRAQSQIAIRPVTFKVIHDLKGSSNNTAASSENKNVPHTIIHIEVGAAGLDYKVCRSTSKGNFVLSEVFQAREEQDGAGNRHTRAHLRSHDLKAFEGETATFQKETQVETYGNSEKLLRATLISHFTDAWGTGHIDFQADRDQRLKTLSASFTQAMEDRETGVSLPSSHQICSAVSQGEGSSRIKGVTRYVSSNGQCDKAASNVTRVSHAQNASQVCSQATELTSHYAIAPNAKGETTVVASDNAGGLVARVVRECQYTQPRKPQSVNNGGFDCNAIDEAQTIEIRLSEAQDIQTCLAHPTVIPADRDCLGYADYDLNKLVAATGLI